MSKVATQNIEKKQGKIFSKASHKFFQIIS
jgi:hypothetical protein